MKKPTSIRAIAAGICSAALMLAAAPLAAQDYPTKPIRVIVGFGAGTTSDIVGRLLGTVMQKQLGQPIIIEPRPGAGGLIAGHLVKAAPPDGYTLYFGSVVSFTSVFTRTNPIDASKEYEPVSDSLAAPYLMVVSNKLNVATLDDLVKLAKSRQQNPLIHMVSIANQAIVMNAIGNAKGFTYTDMGAKNTAEIMPLMATGEVAMLFNVAALLNAGFESKIFRPLFVLAGNRLPRFPDVPTSAEVGLPGLERAGYLGGFWAPKGTPAAITQRLSAVTQAAVRDPDVLLQYKRMEYDPVGSTSQDQLRNFSETLAFWAKVAREANYQPPQ